MVLKHVLDNKVDIIDYKTTENRLLQSSYNSRKREKKSRIERIDEEVQDLRRDVSGMAEGMNRILYLLENMSQPREEKSQK